MLHIVLRVTHLFWNLFMSNISGMIKSLFRLIAVAVLLALCGKAGAQDVATLVGRVTIEGKPLQFVQVAAVSLDPVKSTGHLTFDLK